VLDGVRVGFLDLLSLPPIGERPSGRYRHRGAQHAVDPTTTVAVGAGATEPPLSLWIAAIE
jgi:hypothetical protein